MWIKHKQVLLPQAAVNTSRKETMWSWIPTGWHLITKGNTSVIAMLREQLALANAQITKLSDEKEELKARIAVLDAKLDIEKSEHQQTKQKYDRLQKEHQERVLLFRGIEYRRGNRTGNNWLPFCPKCGVVLHNEDFGFFRCLAKCGWESPIEWDKVQKILNHMAAENF